MELNPGGGDPAEGESRAAERRRSGFKSFPHCTVLSQACPNRLAPVGDFLLACPTDHHLQPQFSQPHLLRRRSSDKVGFKGGT